MPAAKKPAAATASVHAVVGSDSGGVSVAARELASQLAPSGDFGTETIDGNSSGADEAADRIDSTVQALLTFPFFGGSKLVWLKGATFLGDDPTGRSETVLNAIEKLTATLQSGLPSGTVFLLSASPIDKRRSFYKALGKIGSVQVIDAVDTSKPGWEEAAAGLVRDGADVRGLGISVGSAELIALMTGGDRRQIDAELDKLDLYLGPERRDVTEEDVRLLVPISHVGAVFELGNAIAARDLPRALELLDRLLFHGEKAIGILLASIIPTVRSLLLARDLMARHRLSRPANPFGFGKQLERLPANAISHLPRKKDGSLNTFALGIAAVHAQRFTEAELRAALHSCLEANVKLVTSSLEEKVVLSELIVRIVA
jgi:DNA polymerase-3 subunit delta